MQTEVHTYAFSVAANAILSFFPFIVLLLTVTRRVMHSQAMYNVVLQLLRDYLPSNKDFVIRNLQFLASVRGRGTDIVVRHAADHLDREFFSRLKWRSTAFGASRRTAPIS